MSHEEHDQSAEQAIRQAVDEYGWFAALFEKSPETPSFAYTIGFWRTFQQPEIILFGLPTDTMRDLLRQVADNIQAGLAPVAGADDQNVLGAGAVRFEMVDVSNVADYFGYGRWFYNYQPVPLLQMFWPDRAGCFPWETGADERVALQQPLLHRPLDFKFFRPRNEAVFADERIFQEDLPILCVVHDDEGEYQFLTSGDGLRRDPMLVSLERIVKLDPTINQLFDLPRGHYAMRESVDDAWVRQEE